MPRLTRRNMRVPRVPGKAFAVIGMRRAGKTSFLWQSLGDRLREGHPRESLVLLGFEDDRLAGMDAADLDWLLEEYFRRQPEFRGKVEITLCLDEIQTVPGWERFARRVLDTERVALFLSGSSAKLLSREVATALRGRGLEVLVHPFSFREALRHAGREPNQHWDRLNKAERSEVDHWLRQYLTAGGFPEAQGLEARDRAKLLQGYVDVAILRDVIERHAVTNPEALRWLQRQLIGNPGGRFSVQKFYHDLRSQGLAVGKDTLHQYLAHLEDSFLVRTVWLSTKSERRRRVNPRKAYPVDPGLIPADPRTGETQWGHALETAVLVELERRGYEAGYLKTDEGWEVDFLATGSGLKPLLIQVCASAADPAVLERESRALENGRAAHPSARVLLLTMDHAAPSPLPKSVNWVPASRWLLDEEPGT
jgi:predicted AAA+ superfamily ATPase